MVGYFTTEHQERLRGEVRASAESEVLQPMPEIEAPRAVQDELTRSIAKKSWIDATIGRE